MGRDNWILTKDMDENGLYTFKCKHYFNPSNHIRTKDTYCTIDKRNCPVNPSLGKYDCNGIIEVTWTDVIVSNSSIKPNLPKEVREAYDIPS